MSNLGIRPHFFADVGVEDPFEDLATWSDFHSAVDQIDQDFDTFAYEETGVWSDLESYWGYARTAYTGGTDPWFNVGDMNPWENVEESMRIGSEDRADGMIKTASKFARTYSSESSPSRGDEEIPSLMLTDQVASFMYATQAYSRWQAVKQDATFGWEGGEADFMLLPDGGGIEYVTRSQ